MTKNVFDSYLGTPDPSGDSLQTGPQQQALFESLCYEAALCLSYRKITVGHILSLASISGRQSLRMLASLTVQFFFFVPQGVEVDLS